MKAAELPKTYEEFAKHPEWAGRVAIDGTDNEWLKAIFEYYGEQKATRVIKGIVSTLKPVMTDGHLAMARATGAGEYAISLNNYINLSNNVKLAGGPIEVWAMDPVALMFGQVGVSALAPNPNAARLAANFMISQEGAAIHRQVRPAADARGRHRQSARHGRDAAEEEGHSGAADAGGRKGLAAPVSRSCSGRANVDGTPVGEPTVLSLANLRLEQPTASRGWRGACIRPQQPMC